MRPTRTLCRALVIAAMGTSLPAAAAWSSGGGQLVEDANNPWFIKNTTTVSYCVIADEANFGLSTEVAKQRIAEALAFWQNALPGALATEVWPGELPPRGSSALLDHVSYGVGSQHFVLGECGSDTALRFQLGTLTAEQQQRLGGDLSHIVSIAVRTAYDRVHLRGQGFIYVSPEAGPLSLKGDDIAVDRWHYKDGRRLKVVLEHELGHVFGLGHTDDDVLMNEHLTENVLNKHYGSLFDQTLPNPFRPAGGSTVVCDGAPSREWRAFFNLPDGWACRRLEISTGGFTLYGRKDKDRGDWVVVGRANAVAARLVRAGGVCTYLPPEQQVFPIEKTDPQAWPVRRVCGPYVYQERISGTYVTTDGKIRRPYFADLKAGSYELSGVVDGTLVFNVASSRDGKASF